MTSPRTRTGREGAGKIGIEKLSVLHDVGWQFGRLFRLVLLFAIRLKQINKHLRGHRQGAGGEGRFLTLGRMRQGGLVKYIAYEFLPPSSDTYDGSFVADAVSLGTNMLEWCGAYPLLRQLRTRPQVNESHTPTPQGLPSPCPFLPNTRSKFLTLCLD